MKNNDLKGDIQNALNFGFTQKEAVFYLKNKGYGEEEIQEEIFNIYPKITKEDIRKSFGFVSSLIIITLLSFLPLLLSLYFWGEIRYIIVTAVLLTISFGYYKLNRICIWAWTIIISFLVLYFLFGLFWVTPFNHFMFSCLLFSAALLLPLTGLLRKNKELQQQYIFKEARQTHKNSRKTVVINNLKS
ncbi:MAG: hypothetical protein LBM68_02230 [Bacteroidales bacterium]|jgi:hypothetical protein|nr:hypothetical protein [Bacteroidales bacterium]